MRQTHVSSCKTFWKCDESQGCSHQFDGLYFHGTCPEGEEWTAFDYAKGGNLLANSVVLNERRLLLKLRETASNTCQFTFNNLKLDNNSAGSRLLDMAKPGPIDFYVRGLRGQRAQLGPNAINVKPVTNPPNPRYQRVDVDLWPDGELQ
jgi:hypothetical protein